MLLLDVIMLVFVDVTMLLFVEVTMLVFDVIMVVLELEQDIITSELQQRGVTKYTE